MSNRIAVLKQDKCTDKVCGYICEKVCPVNRDDAECIAILPNGKPVIHEELCIGCAICIHKCPVDAIDILNLPEELKEEPIHRYGENGFRVYNMPVPVFGKVIGILGQNGMGKSTVLNALAGIAIPNLGDYSEGSEPSWQKVVDFFKGTEAQAFFEKVRDGFITVSHKPQSVDMIPKMVKGQVKELLDKVNQTDRLNEVVENLDLSHLLENDITKLSGGELQRVAIAACILRKANVYVFDEPTSYLDIKQRVKVSRYIKSLADENTAVVVVEHDLIILDYMTDLIHLMYGKAGTYGVVSPPKSTRNGINIFLSGFLRDENIRFRTEEIKFLARAPEDRNKHIVELTTWKDLAVKLGHFSLTAPEGLLYKNRVVTILGENGIGKTTFVKMLADVQTPDSGEVSEKLTVSYKPQYLEKSDDLVMVVLADAMKKYERQLVEPLQLKHLMERQLDQLSGGELQRVAICLCLSRDADLYLIDEPSAYLDIEQRLLISKVLRDFIEMKSASALVVDHDLMFVDYISDNLIVFGGEPSVKGIVGPHSTMRDGMNTFLKELNITLRRDEESHRPRINKEGSVKDREQKEQNAYYYG